MAVGIVDRSEVVNVEQDQADATPCVVKDVVDLAPILIESAAASGAGQGVVMGQILELSGLFTQVAADIVQLVVVVVERLADFVQLLDQQRLLESLIDRFPWVTPQ